MSKSLPILFAALLLVTINQSSSAQISITGSTFLSLIGESQMVTDHDFESGPVTVNVGSAGPNQTWDFSTIVLSGTTYNRSFLNPASTPYAATFPTANLAWFTSLDQDTISFSAYQYNFVDNSGLTELGSVFDYGDSSMVEISENPSVVNLPVTYNTTWTDVSRDTLDFGGGSMYIIVDSTVNTVDAWGSVTIGLGTYDALRLRADDHTVSATYFNDELVFADTSTSISYEFITADHFIVASIGSADGETDPNFTSAEYVSLLTAITTDTEPDAPSLDGGLLRALYPNPFVTTLTVEYDAPALDVDLGVYDILGRRIRTLAASGSAGLKTATWDGRTDGGMRAAPGIYLVRIESGKKVETQQVVLAR